MQQALYVRLGHGVPATLAGLVPPMLGGCRRPAKGSAARQGTVRTPAAGCAVRRRSVPTHGHACFSTSQDVPLGLGRDAYRVCLTA